MKKIIIFTMLLILSAASFSQQTNSPQSLTGTDHLTKSKKQKTAALVMLIGGTVATTVGVAVAVGGGVDCAYGNPTCGKNHTLATVLAISGSAAILGSIPLFIASGKNKKKAMSLAVSGQPVTWIIVNKLAYKTVPSITLRIGL